MPIEVQAPDGSSITFPDGTDAGVIHNVMTQNFGGGPRTSATGAAVEGALDTAGLGFRDEWRGMSVASGLPEWLGGLRAPVGLGRVGYEYFSGHPGKATEAYQQERDFTRQVQEQAQKEHPTAYLGGQVGGAVLGGLALPAFSAGEGAGMGARAAAAARTGAVYGGVYGAGSGEGLSDTFTQAGLGMATGGVLGGAASPLVDVASYGARAGLEKLGGLYQMMRAETNPSYLTDEATRRILQAKVQDATARGLPFSDSDRVIAQQAGIDLSTADLGGARTLALARSAANQSPEARAELSDLAQERFAGQSGRAAGFIRNLTGGLDEVAEREQLEKEAAISANRAYDLARNQGFREIWTPELQRLSRAPDVRDAILAGGRSEGNEAIIGGNARPRQNPFTTDENGNLVFRDLGRSTAVPDIAFWDGVKRRMQDREGALLRAGKNNAARQTGMLRRALVDQLDASVPEYQAARQGSAAFFNAQDSLEAGRNFVTQRVNNVDAMRALSRMGQPERELFARGFSAEMADRVLELKNNQNVIDQAFLSSAASKQRINAALGPDRARQLEAYLRVEGLSDRLRKELGNSRTAEYLHQLGLAAGPTLGLLAGEHFGGTEGGVWGAILGLGGAFLSHKVTATQRSLATEIGRLLASDDPRVYGRAVDVISRTPWMMNAVRRAGSRLDTIAGRSVQPQIQQPAAQAVEGLYNQNQ